jgi:hypothetical protein
MGEHNHARAALTTVLRSQQMGLDLAEPAPGARDSEVEDLVGLARLDARPRAEGNAGKGRPRGAHNYKTTAWVNYITGRYGSPVEGLMQVARLPVAELARELGCSRLDALREKRACWIAAAPFIHAHLSRVELKPPGAPGGDPVTLDPRDFELPPGGFTDINDVDAAQADGAEAAPEPTEDSVSAANIYCAPLPEIGASGAPSDDPVAAAIGALIDLARDDPELALRLRQRLASLLD